MDELRFDGKVVVVTGAGRGVGRAHALLLAERGAKVVIADLGGTLTGGGASSAPADEVVEEIRAAGGEAVACHESVADEDGAASMIQRALDEWGRLDVLINNAGIGDPERFEDYTMAHFRRMMEVQYFGTVHTTKAAWAHFLSVGGGRVVNTCSEGPLGIHEKMTTYGGAKGGVIGFTLALAAEAPKYNIAVNGFSPRASTRLSAPDVMAKVYDLPEDVFEGAMAAFPPELTSPAAVYLAHESCSLNGVILVCGGNEVLRMAFAQNAGYRSDDPITVEAVAEHLDQILDMSGAHVVGVGSAQTAVEASAPKAP
jgi:NAD(P)-dependent dehydrogenase (short-subunit alcohol dehydrogenase family)